jgi:hypothetical protein
MIMTDKYILMDACNNYQYIRVAVKAEDGKGASWEGRFEPALLAAVLKTCKGMIEVKGEEHRLRVGASFIPLFERVNPIEDSYQPPRAERYVEACGEQFSDAVKKLMVSTTTGDELYQLDSIRLMVEDGCLDLGSTDAQRINLVRLPITDPQNLDVGPRWHHEEDNSYTSKPTCNEDGEPNYPDHHFLIPADSLKLLTNFQGILRIGLSKDERLVLKDNQTSLCVWLRKGKFPDLSDIIKEDNLYNVTINRQAAITMLKQVYAVKGAAEGPQRFWFDSNKFGCLLDSPLYGSAKGEIDMDYELPSYYFHIQPSHLRETLERMHSDWVKLAFGPSSWKNTKLGDEDFKALQFDITGSDDPGYHGTIVIWYLEGQS